MSHFLVAVIGSDWQEQLEPYDESLLVEEYCEKEVSTEDKEKFLKFYQSENESFEKAYEKYGYSWNNYEWRKDEDGIWREYSRYNQDSKWDWFQMGGRWTGMLKAKPGSKGKIGDPGIQTPEAKRGYYDQLLKKDIDIEYMKNKERLETEKLFDIIESILGKEIPQLEYTWDQILERKDNGEDIDDLRKEYHDQEPIKKLRENFEKGKPLEGYWINYESIMIGREAYIQRKINSVMTPFAYIKDGEWFEKGDMGWWGIATNEKDPEKWDKEFTKMFNELPDHALITMIDCHI